jgi:D-Tyr-tRNAtyr deacylase
MFEKYFEISELLRHFYFLIGRLSNDNAAAFKAKAIVTKLLEEKMPFLENKKRKINESKQSVNGKILVLFFVLFFFNFL